VAVAEGSQPAPPHAAKSENKAAPVRSSLSMDDGEDDDYYADSFMSYHSDEVSKLGLSRVVRQVGGGGGGEGPGMRVLGSGIPARDSCTTTTTSATATTAAATAAASARAAAPGVPSVVPLPIMMPLIFPPPSVSGGSMGEGMGWLAQSAYWRNLSHRTPVISDSVRALTQARQENRAGDGLPSTLEVAQASLSKAGDRTTTARVGDLDYTPTSPSSKRESYLQRSLQRIRERLNNLRMETTTTSFGSGRGGDGGGGGGLSSKVTAALGLSTAGMAAAATIGASRSVGSRGQPRNVTVGGSHHYTTLEDTLAYVQQNLPFPNLPTHVR